MSSDPVPETPSARSTAANFAPLITMGTTWALRKALMAGYEAATGKPAPVIHNRQAPIVHRVLWAAAMSATIAAIEIVVWRVVDPESD